MIRTALTRSILGLNVILLTPTMPLSANVATTPLQAASKSPAADAALFSTLKPDTTGLDVLNKMNVEHPMNYLYHSGMTCGGVAVADFDGDGKPDVFFAGTTVPNKLYLQTGGLKFADETEKCGTGFDGGEKWTAGAAVADVNGDGRPDLYLCNYMEPNELWLNLGPGKNGERVTFRECAKAAGVDLVDCSHSAAFADYDGDGKLDLYVLTNRIEDPEGTPTELPIVKETLKNGDLPRIKPEKEKYYRLWRYDFNTWGSESIGTPDHLYRLKDLAADGTPAFEDASKKAGIDGPGDGLSVTWWDPDADGDPDIYVANDFIAGDKWYENNGDGTFTNKLKERVPHTPWFSMGVDFGDVNNDGRLDLLVADMSATSHFKSKTTMGIMGGTELKRSFFDDPPQYMRNALYVNTGLDRFMEGAYTWKVSSTDWTWSVKFADFDLDGWQDLYFTNGISRHMNDSDHKISQAQLTGKHMFDFFKEGEMRKEVNRSFQNSHGEKYVETSEKWGLAHLGVSYGAAYADLDRDGDLDLVEVNLEEPNFIYRNDAAAGNRLLVKLQGTKANKDGIGAMIRIKTKAGQQVRYLSPQTGYLSSNENMAHFGLGEDTEIEELTVRWPFGGVQTLNNVKTGQLLTITQADEVPALKEKFSTTQFTRHEPLSSAKHRDTGWQTDFDRPLQSLLPWSFSQLGPCVACADVDGDGDADFYTGGAAGEIGELRINQGGGKFSLQWVPDFAKDKASEDQGAVFFDADGDGDVDLFVASGSNEFAAGAKELADRLYLNDGKGKFTAAPLGALPADKLVGSCVTAADFDGDGDVDLFVGTRMKSWTYPESEPSRFLRNESSKKIVKFAEDNKVMASLNEKPTMVTASAAADVDGDGWTDLLVAAEWGAVRLFKNNKGTLAEATAAAGLAETTGFWNSIALADTDRDGDLDIIAGNLGLNTKYKTPDLSHPHLAYYGDFDGKGCQLVEVKREGEIMYPERGRSCSSRAMPFIADKFKSFKTFASAKLEEIYTDEKLAKSTKLAVTAFETGIFLNDGGKFTFKPLPRLAQNSPAFGIAAADFNGDGNVDLFLNQNFVWGPQIETGAFGGGLGQLLEGDGKGGFACVEPIRSGLIIPRDNRAVAVMDLDGNGSPDLLGGQNNGPLQAWRNAQAAEWLGVRLPAGSTATVTLIRDGEALQTVSVGAGSGYWSQNDSVAWFGLGKTAGKPGKVKISLPNGKVEEKSWDGKAKQIVVAAK